MSASSKPSSARCCERAWALGAGPGVGPAGDRHRLDDLRGRRASTSRAPGSATPRCSATTRSWPPGPTPVRCCTPGCARARPTPPRGARRFIDELDRPGAPGRRHRRDRGAGRLGVLVQRHDRHARAGSTCATRWRCAPTPTAWPRRSPRSTRTPGEPSTTPPTAKPKSPSAIYTRDRRLIVRRTRLTDRRQLQAVARLASPRVPHRPRRRRRRPSTPSTVDHAVVELAIRDLKEGAGLEHVPSGNFSRQHRLAAMRGARPQPHPLDRHHRPRPPRRRACTVARTVRTGSSPSPAASSTAPAHPPCEARSTGHGATGSIGGCPPCAPCSPPPDNRAAAAGAPQTTSSR